MAACSARIVAVAFAAAAIACDPAGWLLGGARHFEEIDAADAARQVLDEAGWLIQVRQPDVGDPRITGADVVTPDQPLPDRALAADRPIFVIAHDDPSARRFASRLVRAGFARVFVVRGGIQGWREQVGTPPRPIGALEFRAPHAGRRYT